MKIGEKHPSPLLLTSWKIISRFWGIIDFDLSGYFIGLAHRKKTNLCLGNGDHGNEI